MSLERQTAALELDATSDLERRRLELRELEGRPAPTSQADTGAELDAQGADVNSVANLEARIAGATQRWPAVATADPDPDPEPEEGDDMPLAIAMRADDPDMRTAVVPPIIAEVSDLEASPTVSITVDMPAGALLVRLSALAVGGLDLEGLLWAVLRDGSPVAYAVVTTSPTEALAVATFVLTASALGAEVGDPVNLDWGHGCSGEGPAWYQGGDAGAAVMEVWHVPAPS